jgi:hypothetical protein
VLSRSACKVTRLSPLRSKYRRVYVLGSLYIFFKIFFWCAPFGYLYFQIYFPPLLNEPDWVYFNRPGMALTPFPSSVGLERTTF